MTTKKDEVRSTVEALSTFRALKLALEALEECRRDPRLKYEHPYYDKTITAIREALSSKSEALAAVAEPHKQQSAERVEPVAVYVGETWCGSVVRLYEDLPLETPLYTSPQPSKPLTDEQIEQCMKQAYSTVRGRNLELEFARAIEAAHGIYAPSELKENE